MRSGWSKHELDHPQPLDTLLQSVHDPQTAEQVYMASQMAIDQVSEAERLYLRKDTPRVQAKDAVTQREGRDASGLVCQERRSA